MKGWKYILATLLIYSNILATEKEEITELENLYYNKRYNDALIKSELFSSKHPRSRYLKSLKIKMGEGYYIEKKYNIALAVLNDCLQKYELNLNELNKVNILMAKSYIELGEGKKGLEILDRINPSSEDQKNSYIEGIVSQSNKYMDKGELQKSVELLKRNIEKIGAEKELVLNLALVTYNEGKYNQTIEYLKKYNCDSYLNDKLFVNYIYGASYYKIGDNEKAKRYLEFFKYRTGDSCYIEKALLILTELYLKEDNLLKAKEIMNKFSSNSKNYDFIMKEFGDYYLSKGDVDNAQKYYDNIKDNKNYDLEKMYSTALNDYKDKNYEKSRDEFVKLLDSRYRNESFYYLLAIDYQKGNYRAVIEEGSKKNQYNLTPQQELAINSIITGAGLQLKDYKLVESYYERDYKLAPTKDNLYHLIVLESKLKDKNKMEEYIEKYKQLFPHDTENLKNIILLQGNQYCIDGYPNKAIQIYKGFLKNNVDYEVVDNLVEILIRERRYKEGLEYLDKYKKNTPKDDYLRGLIYMGLGEYTKAQNQFSYISDNDNDLGIDKKYNEIRNHFLAERYSKVIEEGREYLSLNNGIYKADVLDKMAISAFRLNDFTKAIDFFKQLKEYPDKKDYAQFQIGEMYYSEKEYMKAAQAYGIVSREGKTEHYREQGAYWQLSALAQNRDKENFSILLKKFFKNFPKSKSRENLLILAAEFYLSEGEEKKGVEIYRKLYDITKNKELKQRALAKILDTSEKNNKMVSKENKELIDNIVNKNEKRYYLGRFYKAKGEIEKAIDEFEKLVGDEEYGDYALSELGDYYYENKEYEKALYYYKKIVTAQTSLFKDKALFRIGEINYIDEDYKGAFIYFAKVCALYPKSKYIIDSKRYLGEIYSKNNDIVEANKKYRELYELTGDKIYLKKLK